MPTDKSMRNVNPQAQSKGRGGALPIPSGESVAHGRGVGRPRTGKRSNPDYRQVSAWVRKDTYHQVTRRLFNEENRREFSDLVQSLLQEWLKAR